jgi:2-dehydro-3-deoxy-D-arabinonate dehydratase
MKLYRTRKGNLLQDGQRYWLIGSAWDELINRDGLHGYLQSMMTGADDRAGEQATAKELPAGEAAAWCEKEVLSPASSQEVWAAGVTYLRSRDARMEESKESGGADFYDKVYEAERPELFFKSLPHRVAAHGEQVYIRRDSVWNVPEPELALFINSSGSIQGYTIGNDMSSRSIEGENPLYLPQAKVYERSASLGPCLFVPGLPIPLTTTIHMLITRGGKSIYTAEVPISQIKRSLPELAGWLFRETDYPSGCFLMTGTCLVPSGDFTLQEGDRTDITIAGIGTLTNHVGYKPLKG